jgi:hypothetical protein
VAGKNKTGSKIVLTPEARVAFPHVFEKYAFGDKPAEEAKFEATLIFPPGTDISLLEGIVQESTRLAYPDGQVPARFNSPFRKGSERSGYEGFHPDSIFITAKTDFPPEVLGINRKPLTDSRGFYGGCWAHAHIHAYAYDRTGNRGISFGLDSIRKTRDDKAFGRAGVSYANEYPELERPANGADTLVDE